MRSVARDGTESVASRQINGLFVPRCRGPRTAAHHPIRAITDLSSQITTILNESNAVLKDHQQSQDE